jgi:hypothetical protein
VPKKNAGFSKPRRARSDIFPVGRQNTNVCLKGEGIDLVGLGKVLLGREVLEILQDMKPADCFSGQRDNVVHMMALGAARNKPTNGLYITPLRCGYAVPSLSPKNLPSYMGFATRGFHVHPVVLIVAVKAITIRSVPLSNMTPFTRLLREIML